MYEPNHPVIQGHSILADAGWREFNERLWNITSEELTYTPRGENGPSLEVIAYKDKSGRFVLPSMHPNWHMQFQHTNTTSSARIYRQWDELSKLMVDDMVATGTHGRIAFPAEITDVRNWLWTGFRSHPLYTIMITFPYSVEDAESTTRRRYKKSVNAGFQVQPAKDTADVIPCLMGTEKRKKFDHCLTAESLQMGLDLMGPDKFRLYVAYAPDGEPASARLVIMEEGGICYDIAAGTQEKYLTVGATQHTIGHVLMDVQQAGATAFNFSCANIESVSPAKLCWGGQLVPLHGIEGFDYLPVRRTVGSFVRLMRNRSRNKHNSPESHQPETVTNS
ncbi:hypothetical protein Pla110_30530 [Polystyrenella longa]|uniref:BioF2-like acetyltransferase domain-containing protein n=1 Tax=Polystyrenella longa TaxID=2528007 RepID=A0A518CQ05_9PLAN|nr:hypothetical protein [Polystyrenella longa]QDU81312.1 hypothetical protein Pla110_30530 [Polystyrenella longa]